MPGAAIAGGSKRGAHGEWPVVLFRRSVPRVSGVEEPVVTAWLWLTGYRRTVVCDSCNRRKLKTSVIEHQEHYF